MGATLTWQKTGNVHQKSRPSHVSSSSSSSSSGGYSSSSSSSSSGGTSSRCR